MSVRRKLKMFVESINRSSSVSDLAETAWLIGDSSLHTAIYKGNEQELQILVNNINPAERLNTFLLKNRNSFTLLDEAVNERNSSVVKFVLNSLPDDNDRFLLIQSRGCRGWTTLHRAVQTHLRGAVGVEVVVVEVVLGVHVGSHVLERAELWITEIDVPAVRYVFVLERDERDPVGVRRTRRAALGPRLNL